MGQKWAAAETTCDKATYDELKSFVSDADNIRIPNTGYYRIKNVSSNNYVGYGTAGYAGKGVGLIEVSEDNLSSVLHLTKVSDGVYTISTQGLNVQTQAGNNQPVRATADAGSNHTFTVLAPGVVSIRANQEDAYGYWFRSPWGNAPESIITWEVSSDVAKWTVEEATSVSIPLNYDGFAYSYGTMYLPFGVTLTGANAYILSVSDEWAIPSEIAAVPANTPVLVRADGEVSSVTATINDAAAAETTGNQLAGTFVDITTDRVAGEYILGMVDGSVGFYQRGSGMKIGANKAYLSLGEDLSSGAVKGFRWDLAVGVNSLTPSSTPSKGDIFNLAGQRLSKLQRGVKIVNGRKVIVK